ncbi:MAG TPA: hypothetical protein VHB21_09230, partial [Minicystis sp.]|nr:hypothetical protein [Minicystis sp.]
MSNRVLLLLSSLALLATGCVRETFALPMTAAELARVGSGPALVAYLGQRDATPAVCDARSAGPHLARFDDEVRDALVDGLVDGHVDPDLWRRCAKGFLRSAPPEASASLLDAIGAAYERLVKRSDFETSPARQAAVAAMQRLYLERDHGTDGHAGELDPRFSDLRRAIAEKRIGAVAARFGAELLVAVDLEHGLYEGQPVDGATIDRLYAAGDERALHLFADRLPRADLRDEARRRIVRIHVAKSPFPEVRAAAAAYEELVMRQGNAPVSLTEHAPGRAWIDTGPLPARGVLVRQDVLRGTAKLLAWSGAPGVSVVPEVPLRGALYVEVAGVSRPITVCAPPKDLDTSPCVAARDLASEQPAAYVDARGALHFVEHVPTQAVLDLAAAGPRLATPIRVGASARAPLVWPLWFERPGDLVFRGQGAGSRGPALSVLVDRHNPERLVFSLRVGAASYAA